MRIVALPMLDEEALCVLKREAERCDTRLRMLVMYVLVFNGQMN